MSVRCILVLTVLSLWCASSRAQTGAKADSTQVTGLEEVSVVAVKQSSSLRGQPVAASIVTAPQLNHLNVVAIKGLSDVVPNFYIPDYGSRITSTIYVRGIGARIDQPSVGLNVDNVPVLNKNAYDFDLSDMVSVEMLRGPQSTLFGRNTMAGLINIQTLSPMSYQGWRLSVQTATNNPFRGSAGWYHRFGRNFGIAAIASFSASSGFYTNDYDSTKLDRERLFNFRLKAQWNPSRRLRISNAANIGMLRQGGYPYASVQTGKISYNDTCFYHRVTVSDGLTLGYTGDRLSLTSITSYQFISDNLTLDQDFLPLDYFTLMQKQHETGVTQDLVFKPVDDGGIYRWLFGAFAFHRHQNMTAPVTFKNQGISSLIEDHRNSSNPDYPIQWDSRSFVLNSNFRIPTWGLAAYHESRLDLDRWHFTAGVRLDYEHTTLKYHSDCSTGYTIMQTGGGGELTPMRHVPVDIDDRGERSRHFLTLLPKITALYDISADDNVYLNISKGYKSGGFNTQMFSDVLQQRLMGIMGVGASYDIDEVVGYKPEQSWNFEVGAHLDFLGGRLLLDGALFYIYCRDQQLTMFPDGTTTGRIMTNAGKTRSWGGEASLTVKPVEGMVLRANYGYTNATFIHFFDGHDNFSGNALPYVPRNTLFLQALYTFPNVTSWLSGLTFDINMKGTGRIYWNEANTLHQNMYFVTGISATFTGRRGDFQVWVRNLNSVSYDTFYFVSMGNEFLQRGRPREIGMTLRINI